MFYLLFLLPRLRSVRQDMFIQQLGITEPLACIMILESCVHFYTYGKFKMAQERMDHHIVTTHLQNCMNYLVQLYCIHWKTFEDGKLACCVHHLAAHVLRSVHQPDIVLQLLMMFPIELRQQKPLKGALQLTLALLNRNYFRVFKVISDLRETSSYYLLMSCYHHLPGLRSDFLKTLSASHNSKMCKFPLSTLSTWLCLTNAEAVDLCKSHGLTVSGNEHVKFLKVDFKTEAITHETCTIYHDIIQRYDNCSLLAPGLIRPLSE